MIFDEGAGGFIEGNGVVLAAGDVDDPELLEAIDALSDDEVSGESVKVFYGSIDTVRDDFFPAG